MSRDYRGSGSTVGAESGGSRSAGDEDEAPVQEPEYGDLLDAKWLERGSEALDPEDELIDIGLTIDMADSDGAEEGPSMELDVGSLLTSLPLEDEASERDADREGDGAGGISAVQDLLLPDEGNGPRREDDDEVGNDERFPAFDDVSVPRPSAPLDDDAEGPQEDERTS